MWQVRLPEGVAGRPCVFPCLMDWQQIWFVWKHLRQSWSALVFSKTGSPRIMSGGTKSDVVLTHIGYRDEVMVYKQGVKERLRTTQSWTAASFVRLVMFVDATGTNTIAVNGTNDGHRLYLWRGLESSRRKLRAIKQKGKSTRTCRRVHKLFKHVWGQSSRPLF